MSSKIVTVHCAVNCANGKAPSEADVAEMLRQIELYAVQRGYIGVIETRQYWGPALTVAPAWATDIATDYWCFIIYRDYNAPVAP